MSVNADNVDLHTAALYHPGTLRVLATTHTSIATVSNMRCVASAHRGTSQTSNGTFIALNGKAGDRFLCQLFTFPAGGKPVARGTAPVPPDVVMAKSVGSPTSEVGSTNLNEWRLTVTNTGAGNVEQTAFQLVVTDFVDPRLPVRTVVPDDPSVVCTSTDLPRPSAGFFGQNVSCTKASLAARSSFTIVISFNAPVALLPNEDPLIINWAEVTLLADAQPSNNRDPANLTLVATANVEVLTCCNPNITAGVTDPTPWTTTVRNRGLSSAFFVSVNIYVPGVFQLEGAGVVPAPDPITGPFGASCTLVQTNISLPVGNSLLLNPPGTPAGQLFNRWVCSGFNLTKDQTLEFRYSATVAGYVAGPNGAQTLIYSTVGAMTPDVTGPNDHTLPVRIVLSADVRIGKSSDFLVYAGNTATYAISVTNGGPSWSYNVIMRDEILLPFQVLSWTTTQGTCVAEETIISGGFKNLVICSLGTVPAATPANPFSVNITITSFVPPGTTPTISNVSQRENPANAYNNTATVTAITSDPDLPNNQDPAFFNVIDVVDLSIVKTCQAGDLVGGTGRYSFFIEAANYGPSSARTIRITDLVPSEFINLSVTVERSPSTLSCGFSGTNLHDLLCTLAAPLAPTAVGAQRPIRIRIDFDVIFGITVNPTVVPNTATVTSTASLEISDFPNFSTCQTTLVPPPDVTIDKVPSQSRILSDNATRVYWYDITVVNAGPGNAQNVRVRDTVRSPFIGSTQSGSFVSVTVPGFTTTFANACLPQSSGQVLDCTFASMGVGNVTIRIPFTVPFNTPAQIVGNCANVSSLLDRNSTNNEKCVDVAVETGTILTITKSSSRNGDCTGANRLVAGGDNSTLFFTIDTTNVGPARAVNVTMVDNLEFPFVLRPGTLTVTRLPNVELNPSLCTVDTTGFGSVRCSFGDLAAGETIRVRFGFGVASSVRQNVYTNRAQAFTNTFQISGADPIVILPVTVCNLSTLSIDKTGETKVVAGLSASATGPYTYQFNVTNAGPSDAENLVVVDDLPQGFVAVPGSASIVPNLKGDSCSISTIVGGRSRIRCEFSGLFAANRVENIFVLFSVKEDTPEGPVVNRVFLTSTSDVTRDDNHTTIVDNIVNLRITKAGPTVPVCAGSDGAQYFITLYNAGPSRAYTVRVVDTFPFPTMQLSGAIVTSGSNALGPIANNLCTMDVAGVIVCNFGDLPPSTEAEPRQFQVNIVYSLIVPETESANLIAGVNNTAVASSGCSSNPNSTGGACVRDVEESFLPNNTAIWNTKICAFADLRIVKTANQPIYIAGALDQDFFFTLAVYNLGPARAYNVSVTDSLFTGGTIYSVTSPRPGALCSVNPPRCTFPFLNVDEETTVKVSFRVEQAQLCSTYTNRGVIVSDTSEPNPNLLPNESTIPVPIEAQHDIVVSKVGPQNVTAGGASRSFTVSVRNDGPSRALNVVFIDAVPWPLRVSSASATGGVDCTVAAAVPGSSTLVRCNIGTMDANAIIIVTYTFSVDSNANLGSTMTVTNTASAFANGGPGQVCPVDPATVLVTGASCEYEIRPNNNCDSWTTDLLCSSDVNVNKTDFQTTVTAGDGILYNYTIRVWNSGLSTARTVKVVDSPFPFVPGNNYFDLIGTPTIGLGGTPCSIAATGFECEIGDLLAGEVRFIYAFYRVKDNAPAGTAVNTVRVSTSCTETNDTNTFTDFTEVLNAADMGIVKDDCVEQVCAGDRLNTTFVLTVTNSGPSRGVNVVVTDTVPAVYIVQGLPQITGYTTGATCEGEQLANNLGYRFRCTWATFPVGEIAYIRVDYKIDTNTPAGWATNCARVANNVNDPNQVNNEDCDTNRICNLADLEVKKFLRGVAEDKCIVAGAYLPVFYEIIVTNLGPSTSRAVEVYESFPAGVTILSVPPTCRNVPAGSRNYTCTIPPPVGPNLVVGAVAKFTFDIRVGASVPAGEIRNNVTVWSPITPDPDLCNNNATEVSLVCLESDLGVTKNDGVTNLTAGELDANGNPVTYTYTIVGTNYGPSDAVNVVFTDVWPATTPGFNIVGLALPLPAGLTCTPVASPKGYRCVKDFLAANTSVTFGIIYTVDPCAVACEYCNLVTIRSSAPEGADVHPNTAQDCNTVRAEADLSVCKSDGVTMVTAGELGANGLPLEITYTVVVTNNGPSCAQKVSLVDRFPAEVDRIRFGLVDGPQYGSCISVDIRGHPNSISCDLLTLKPGETRTVTATYTVPANTTTCSVTNVANVKSLITFDPRQCNNDARDVNALIEKAELAITKNSTSNTIAEGFYGNNTFSIFVWNKGPSYAREVVLTDIWPSGLIQYREAITVTGVGASSAVIVSTGGDVTVHLGDLAPGIAYGKTVHIPYSLMDKMGPGFIYNRASVFSHTDSECRHTIHTTQVVAVAKRAVPVKRITTPAKAAPAHEAFHMEMPTHAPTEAPVQIDGDLPVVRVTVVAERISATKFVLKVSSPASAASVRLAAVQMRVTTPTTPVHVFDVTAQSAEVAATTCDSLLERRFGKNWELKCHFELATALPANADVVFAVSGAARSSAGVALAMGSVHM